MSEWRDVGKVNAQSDNESWLYLEHHGELMDLIEVFEKFNGEMVSVSIKALQRKAE